VAARDQDRGVGDGRQLPSPNRHPVVAREDLCVAVCIGGLIGVNALPRNCCSTVRDLDHARHHLRCKPQAGA
jgi:hypothetical protein